MPSERENLIKKIDLCIDKYNAAFGDIPTAAVVADSTLGFLQGRGMLRNLGKQKGDYSGKGLESSWNFVPRVYFFEEMNGTDIEELKPGEDRLYKPEGKYPLMLTTHKSHYGIRRFFGGKRFENTVSCDIGVPINQLEQELTKKINRVKNPKDKA